MPRRPTAVLLGFAAWTFLVWATRVDNVLGEDGLGAADRAWRIALAASFAVPAAVLAVLVVRRRAAAAPLARVLAAWTVAVWAVRATGIVLADHDTAFTLVHVALGLVSAALAVAAWRAQSQWWRLNTPTSTTVNASIMPRAKG